jgi:hypothetical protein
MSRPFCLVLIVLLAAAPAENAAQTSTARVTGRVVDTATGEPIAGARVILGTVPTGARGATPPAITSRPVMAETNADGVFVLADVPLGRWRIQVQKTGFFVVGASGQQAAVVDVAANMRVPDIQLDRGGAIAGRVVDVKGNPVSDVSVTAIPRIPPAGGTAGPGNSVTAQTNDLGEFRLAGLSPGEFHVVARPRPVPILMSNAAAPSRTVVVQTYYPGVVDVAGATPVLVMRGMTTSALDLQILAVDAYQVSGVAVDASGRPAPGAMLQLLPVPTTTPLRVPLNGTAQADGTFRIANVPAGTYRIQAAMPVVVRTEKGSSTSVSFGAPGRGPAPAEIFVSGADVAGVQVVVRQP